MWEWNACACGFSSPSHFFTLVKKSDTFFCFLWRKKFPLNGKKWFFLPCFFCRRDTHHKILFLDAELPKAMLYKSFPKKEYYSTAKISNILSLSLISRLDHPLIYYGIQEQEKRNGRRIRMDCGLFVSYTREFALPASRGLGNTVVIVN